MTEDYSNALELQRWIRFILGIQKIGEKFVEFGAALPHTEEEPEYEVPEGYSQE
ncbi:MAG: hypothetical protein [Chaetfec virus UA24_144]|nr:MAG: hypothetical protein [Chaetfec virus UA24_144]